MNAPFELPVMTPCVFCEMIAGRLDKGLVEQTAQTLTIVNHRQFEIGQALVIPRRHAPTILDLTDEESAALMGAVRRVSAAMVKAYSPDGITLYNNNGVASMQEVPHFHTSTCMWCLAARAVSGATDLRTSRCWNDAHRTYSTRFRSTSGANTKSLRR